MILYVLLTSGVVSIFRATDVMLHYPAMLDSELAQKSTPAKKSYVGDPTSPGMPTDADEKDLAGSGAAMPTESMPAPASSTQSVDYSTGAVDEPVDEERFLARASLCTSLRILQMQTQQQIQHLAPAFSALYLRTDINDESINMDDSPMLTTLAAAKAMSTFLGEDPAKITRARYLATHTMLMEHPKVFVADMSAHRESQTFTRRSKEQYAVLDEVSRWVRSPPGTSGYNYVFSFAEKIRALRAWKKENAHLLSSEGDPRQVEVPDPPAGMIAWTSQHLKIISFLKANLGTRRNIQEDVFVAMAMDIIKRCDASTSMLPSEHAPSEFSPKRMHNLSDLSPMLVEADSDLQHGLMMCFLREIDSIAPWQNPLTLDAGLHALVGSEAAEHGADTKTQDRSPVNANALTSDENKRVEFHEPVYVMDDESAHELDDGVSLERIPGTEDQVWIHVHVADPTALLRPGDEVSTRAARRHTSVYFPETRWSLLPNDFVNSGVGLGAAGNQPQRAMTFSAKVGSDGTVSDYKVQLSMLKDVRVFSYETANRVLFNEAPDPALEAVRPDLETLQSFARALASRRHDNFAVSNSDPGGVKKVMVSPLPLLMLTHQPGRHSTYAGFPTIKLNVPVLTAGYAPVRDPTKLRSSDIVGELMILAGRVGGAFGLERDIALPYRGQGGPTDAESLTRLAHLPRAPDGGIPVESLLTAGISFRPAYTTDRPASHFSMGLKVGDHEGSFSKAGYLRATSPLRRYPDLVTHWQIRSALLGESIPWSRAAMLEECASFDRLGAVTKSIQSNAERFWIFTYIRKVLERGAVDESADEDERILQRHLLGVIDAQIRLGDVRMNPSTMKGMVRVQFESTGLPAECEWPIDTKAPLQAEVGKTVKVKISGVIQAGLRNGLYCVLA